MIKKVIIPVAGLGTRFLPATKALPKEMLPIVDKPVVQFLVEEAICVGIEDVIFVTGRNKRAIEDHFDFSPEVESSLLSKNKKEEFDQVRSISHMARFAYVRQNTPKGDGDAILCAEHLAYEDAVAILFGDDIVVGEKSCLAQMVDVFNKYGGIVVALETVPKEDVHKYGVVKALNIEKNIYEIQDIVEKPKNNEAPSNIVLVGKYIITKSVFDELNNLKDKYKDEELRLSYALREVLKKEKIHGIVFEGKRYDCGSKIGFLEATVDFALKHNEVKGEFEKFIKQKFNY